MPTTRAATNTTGQRPCDILSRLASNEQEIKLKALREVKNQIIGNRTKKLSFVKLGAVVPVASILADFVDVTTTCGNNDRGNNNDISNILVQSAAVLGSFGCNFDPGVQAVLDAGAFPNLLKLLSSSDEKANGYHIDRKRRADFSLLGAIADDYVHFWRNVCEQVVDAGARSLRMIYHSKLAPKYDFLQEKNMESLVSLLNSENENVSGLGASIITHSCRTNLEQKVLCDAGVLDKLINLFDGSLSQRSASLEALGRIFKNNTEVVSMFVALQGGKSLNSVMELVNDRYPRTRLLACMCLIILRNTSSCYLQDVGSKTKLIHTLLELLDDPSQVGDEASFTFSKLIAGKEDIQKLAHEANAIDKLYNHLQEGPHPKRFEGVLLALADMCSRLETCRSRFLSLQVLNLVADALNHDYEDVRAAACICLRSVTRSIKNLSAGLFTRETVVAPLVRLLRDPSTSVQVAALGAITNIMVDFATHKSTFIQCGGVQHLVQLSKSMDPLPRLNALWALRNLIFLGDSKCKELVISELTASLLASLISDPEPSVQEQALAVARNLVDGCLSSIEYLFDEDSLILDAVGRQMRNAAKAEVGIQGMYVFTNVASGNELHKEAVMRQLFPRADNKTQNFMLKFLQSSDSRLRTATAWTIINLTCPSSPGAFSRHGKLRNEGIVSQIKNMVNDPCLDVKLRIRTALGQSMSFGDG